MAFDKTLPLITSSLKVSHPQILANWSALESALGQDHDFSTGGTQTGKHTVINLAVQASTPSAAADYGQLYVKDVGGVAELHWQDESGNEVVITKGGMLATYDEFAVLGSATSDASILLYANGAANDNDKWRVVSEYSTHKVLFQTYASGSWVSTMTIDISGNIAVAGTVDGVDISENINQDVRTSASPTFAGLSINGNIVVTGTVDGVDVAALESDVNDFPDELKNLDTVEIQQLENIGSTTISTDQWGYLGACSGIVSPLSASSNKAEGTTYQAEADGFVIVTVEVSASSSYAEAYILSNSYTPPDTEVAYASVNYDTNVQKNTILYPVKKGNYYKAGHTGSGTISVTVDWIPFSYSS